MDDSRDMFGQDPAEQDGGEQQPSAAELEAAGQSALFGGGDDAAPPQAEPAESPAPAEPAKATATQPASSQPYRVLARKYRPQTFSELIGQEAMVQTLANAIKRDRLAHAFLMTGVRGVGKTSTARLIAKALNCIGPDGQGGPTIDPCGKCEPCVAIAEGRHIDVIEMDAASHTGVDDVREIIEAVRYAAVSARYKIYIIDEVHMLSRNAFNALLKTLEEPPAHVKFLFATTEVEKLPVTVLSRCQRFDLRRIAAPMLAGHFAGICAKENIEAEEEALGMIAAAAEGSVRDGLSILDQAIAHADLDGEGKVRAAQVRDMLGLADRSAQRNLFTALLDGNGEELLQLVERQYSLGVEPLALMRGAMDLTHRITVTQVSESVAEAASAEERDAIAQWAEALRAGQLHRLWQLLLKGFDEVRTAPDPLIAAKMALLRVMHASDMPDPGDLVKKLEEAASRQPVTPASMAPHSAAADAPVAVNMIPAMEWTELVHRVGRRHVQIEQVMKDWVRVGTLAPGVLRIAFADGYSLHTAKDLRDALEDATGHAWTVELLEGDAAGQTSPTLREQAEAIKAAQAAEIRSAPLVEATLAAFPNAELVDEDEASRHAQGGRGWRR